MLKSNPSSKWRLKERRKVVVGLIDDLNKFMDKGPCDYPFICKGVVRKVLRKIEMVTRYRAPSLERDREEILSGITAEPSQR